MSKNFLDIKIGDIVIVHDEFSHDYLEHRIKIENVEYNEEYVTETNPHGMVCYGVDLDEDEWGDNYINIVAENTFCTDD